MRKLGANACGKIRRGRDFDHLLMPPLHGAVALVKMQQVAVMIPQDLHFEMPRTRQIFFQEHGSVTERRVRFALGLFEQRIELHGVGNHAHAAAAPAHGGFDDDRVTDFPRYFLRFSRRLDRVFRSGQHGHARGGGKPACGGFVA